MGECLADRAPHGDMLVVPLDVGRGNRFPTHQHEHHQLVWAASGVLTVEVGTDSWTLPPNLALWMPLGTPHAVIATKPSAMKGVYFQPDGAPDWAEPTLVTVGALLRELLLHLSDPGWTRSPVHGPSRWCSTSCGRSP